ncbi:MAG: DUF642 domain-containing protein [Phycisphaerales bacterium]|nr:DUF642 domain-containing protein [Phycisphaerales bacterium]
MQSTRLIVPAILAAAAPMTHASIVNSGFEPDTTVGANNVLPAGSTAIPGWTTIENGVEWFNPAAFGSTVSPNGGYAVDLANFTFSSGGIQQSFATIAGQSYTVEFYASTSNASGRTGTAEIFVDADGTTEQFNLVNMTSQFQWDLYSFTFIADDEEATLTFANYQDANLHFANIDGVSVVPAPATAIMLLAFGSATTRRRR